MRNKFEHDIARQLRRGKVKHKYECRKIPYYWVGHYTPDWEVTNGCGDVFILEAKGYFRAEDKRKLLAVRKTNPTLDIRIVFYRYSKVNVKWCEKHGFLYAIQKVPKEWLQ